MGSNYPMGLGLAVGIQNGILSGIAASRQRALDESHMEMERRRMAMQERLAESLIEERKAQTENARTGKAYDEFNKPIDAMIGKYPELAGELSDVSGLGGQYAKAPDQTPPGGTGVLYPPVVGKDQFLDMRRKSLEGAGQHAERIRKENYEQALEVALSKVTAAGEAKASGVRDNIKKSLGIATGTGRINLPNGVSLDAAVDNLMGGSPNEDMLPTVPMNNRERDTLDAVQNVEGMLRRMAAIKGGSKMANLGGSGQGVDTGPLSGAWYKVRSAVGIPHPEAAKLNPVSVRNMFNEVKAQSGAQYGMRELEALSNMVPNDSLQDNEWWARFNEAWNYHQQHKARITAALKASRRTMPQQGQFVPPAGSQTQSTPAGPVPDGFIPE